MTNSRLDPNWQWHIAAKESKEYARCLNYEGRPTLLAIQQLINRKSCIWSESCIMVPNMTRYSYSCTPMRIFPTYPYFPARGLE